MALVSSSYASYRMSKDLVVGLSVNAPFGLGSEPDNYAWSGRLHGETSKLFTLNVAPTVAYQIIPGLIIGAGLQMEYAKLTFKFASGGGLTPTPGGFVGAPSAGVIIKDKLALGYTLGAHWTPVKGTTLGLGFRSSLEHDFEGVSYNLATKAGSNVKATLETPETVTFSLRQDLTKDLRLLGTVEWANWSRFDKIPITCTSPSGAGNGTGFNCATGNRFALLEADWHNGWFYSAGLEWDTQTPGLTLRGGVAIEKSPVQNASERLPQVPDSDRIWLSGGLSYRLFANTMLDMAYTHIIVEDAEINRGQLLNNAVRLVANRRADVDIVSVGFRTKW